MKEYEILSIDDFDSMVKKFHSYFRERAIIGKPFPRLKIVAKRWVKSKSSPQHRTYWFCIAEMKKAFWEQGCRLNEDEIHEFVKHQAGYTKSIPFKDKSITVTKSIKDSSEDVNTEEMVKLIDFMIEWTATNLNYVIPEFS